MVTHREEDTGDFDLFFNQISTYLEKMKVLCKRYAALEALRTCNSRKSYWPVFVSVAFSNHTTSKCKLVHKPINIILYFLFRRLNTSFACVLWTLRTFGVWTCPINTLSLDVHNAYSVKRENMATVLNNSPLHFHWCSFMIRCRKREQIEKRPRPPSVQLPKTR